MIEKIYSLFLKSNGICTDTRNIIPNSIFFALKGENFDANQFAEEALLKGAAYVIIDNKKHQTNPNIILVNDSLKTLQKLASHHRNVLAMPIIALTGSNGKTTTKELINAVLSQKYKTTATIGNLNNHIGVPLTLLSMSKETDIGIVEMGANHPNEIDFLCNMIQPDYGYITNFGKAHLEGFGNIEGVIQGKTELYTFLRKKEKTVFVNENDKTQRIHSKGMNKITFGTKQADILTEMLSANPNVFITHNETIIKSNLIGNYNYNNIAVAIAFGSYFKIETYNIKKAIEEYIPTNNRSQIITKGNIKIILDAYNANPTSMEAALNNFSHITDIDKIAILGDMFEIGKSSKEEHQKISDLAGTQDFKKVFLIGENFYKTINPNKNTVILKTYIEFEKQFKKEQFQNTTILIKASRGMALERIVSLF